MTQEVLQPSPLTLLPSSHCSVAGSTLPSPHQDVLPADGQSSPQPIRAVANTPVSSWPSPASHTTKVSVCTAEASGRLATAVSRGVVPSYCVPLSVMTLAPSKNGPLIEIWLPPASTAMFLPSTKMPTTSLNAWPTYSGNSSEPTM